MVLAKDTQEEQGQESAIGENALEQEMTERWKAVSTHYSGWERLAKEDYKFALGDQWTPEDLNILKEQGRPALTFNRIRPLLNLVSGYQRENTARIKVNPEGGEDKVFSDVMDRGIKFIDKGSHFTFKAGFWFDDGLYCGKGFLEAVISYDKDPIRGSIKFMQRSPYQILVDPENIEYDLNEGAGYLFKVVRLPKYKLKELYPDQADLIDGFTVDNDDKEINGAGIIKEGGDNDDYQNRPDPTTIENSAPGDPGSGLIKDGKFTVKEYWRPKKVKKYFVINVEDGEPQKFNTQEDAKSLVDKQGSGEIIERMVPEMWVSARVGGFVLQDEISPFEPFYSGYPFFRYLADWAPNAETEELKVQGVTRTLKDPQKEKNKAKSQYLHILNTQANSGWIGDDDALSNNAWKELKKMGSKPGIVIRKKKNSELREIQAKTPNQGQVLREQQADEEFKQVSGINPDLLGTQDKTASGRAISLRIKQAITALVRLFANYRYSKEIVGDFMLQMVPMLFDVPKLKKIVGPDFMKKAVDEEKYPDGLDDGQLAAFLTMIKDRKYDVLVTEADANATVRHETFQELSELLKAGAPIPMDLIIDYMDLPNGEEIKKKVQEQQEVLAQAAAQGNK